MARALSSGVKIRGVLIDITGVLYESGQVGAIPGSIEAFEKLKDSKIPFKFVTNETQNTRLGLVNKLRSYGFDRLQVDDICAPSPAVKEYLVRNGLRPHLLIHEGVEAEFDGVEKSNPNCVVIGDAGERFTYENLNEAFRVLISLENPILISMGKGRYYKEKGILTMDNGPYTVGLEHACDTEAVIIGKPAKEFFHNPLRLMNVKPEEAVMIGDDILSDVGAAQNAQISGILVKTGKFRPQLHLNHRSVLPDAIVDNFLAAVNLILSSTPSQSPICSS